MAVRSHVYSRVGKNAQSHGFCLLIIRYNTSCQGDRGGRIFQHICDLLSLLLDPISLFQVCSSNTLESLTVMSIANRHQYPHITLPFTTHTSYVPLHNPSQTYHTPSRADSSRPARARIPAIPHPTHHHLKVQYHHHQHPATTRLPLHPVPTHPTDHPIPTVPTSLIPLHPVHSRHFPPYARHTSP